MRKKLPLPYRVKQSVPYRVSKGPAPKPSPQQLRSEQKHEARVKNYKKHYAVIGERLLGSMLRLLATVDAAQSVNSYLASKFGLPDVSLDVSDVRTVAQAILRLEITEILVSKSCLSEKARDELVNRIVSRHFPKRDNIPGANSVHRQPSREERVADIESVISRELKRSFSANGNKS
jgi:hypothetical protein